MNLFQQSRFMVSVGVLDIQGVHPEFIDGPINVLTSNIDQVVLPAPPLPSFVIPGIVKLQASPIERGLLTTLIQDLIHDTNLTLQGEIPAQS